MSTFSVISPAIYSNDLDIAQFLEKFSVKLTAPAQNVTTFGSGGWVTRNGGLKTVASEGSGFADFSATGSDSSLFTSLGVKDQVLTTCPQGTETSVAYFYQAGRFAFTPLDAKVGDASAFMISSQNTNPIGAIRGQLAKLKGSVSATGQLGSILTIAGPTSSQFVYASVHVLTAGTTVTIHLESATTVGFGSPTTRATIGPLTTTGGTFMTRVAGAITDGFWRFNVSAITGTFSLAGAIGIQ